MVLVWVFKVSGYIGGNGIRSLRIRCLPKKINIEVQLGAIQFFFFNFFLEVSGYIGGNGIRSLRIRCLPKKINIEVQLGAIQNLHFCTDHPVPIQATRSTP